MVSTKTPSYVIHDLKNKWNSAQQKRRMINFYSHLIKKGDIVYDIGANHGNRTEIFLGIGATVVAIEPQPSCQEDLKRLFGHDQRFTLVPCAAGSSNGRAMMHIASIDEVSSMSDAFVSFWRTNGRFGKCNWDKEIEVELVTLESLFVRYGIPQFCKIDVEGFEVEVLKGLNQPIPQLSFEFTPGLLEPFIKAMDRIDSLGNYEFNYSSGESMKMDLPRFVSSDSIRNAIGNISESACYTDIYARKKD